MHLVVRAVAGKTVARLLLDFLSAARGGDDQQQAAGHGRDEKSSRSPHGSHPPDRQIVFASRSECERTVVIPWPIRWCVNTERFTVLRIARVLASEAREKRKARRFPAGLLDEVPATSYSPTQLPTQYHRR